MLFTRGCYFLVFLPSSHAGIQVGYVARASLMKTGHVRKHYGAEFGVREWFNGEAKTESLFFIQSTEPLPRADHQFMLTLLLLTAPHCACRPEIAP
ncbi:hypothetical protein RRG08_007563 [Elysia crispata]|uniref:Secreted protein n=1 Tax=Elysia crispata TaxID=231223 RepID=A0AAE0Z2Y2_9GAST|nr:hypothetical protein RRG08_007563 [Elysia crispata]